ncbi:TetR/AcrR family transcriptional regulator [Actinospongicola halichondriae]|uniref:TetR/AcrR family transcriptional regulator n=1 Tax=Actinospongicola halichondriae TaxID=3236844 RepID=UPI003D4CA542
MARPRSEDARRRVVEAAVEALLALGVEGVTIEDLAARSGVAKSTIYRHFGNLDCVVTEAFRSRIVEYPTPDTGSLEADVQELFARYDLDDHRQLNELMPLLLEAARRDPALCEVRDRILGERQRPLRTIVKLAQARGEIDPDLDLDIAMAMLTGPLTYRKMVQDLEVDDAFLRVVLPGAVAALRSTAG